MEDEFVIYPGRSNTLKIILTSDNVPIVHTSITRLAIYVGSLLVDSNTHPEWFDLTNAGFVNIKLGQVSPAIPTAHYSCKLVVYDVNEFSLGYIWPQTFLVHVAAEIGDA